MALTAVFQIGSLGDTIVSIPTLLSLRERIPGCTEYLLVSRFDGHAKVMPSHVFDMVWRPAHQVNYDGPGVGIHPLWSAAETLARLRYYRPRHCVYLMPTRRTIRQIDRDKLFFNAAGIRDLHGFQPIAEEEASSDGSPLLQTTEAYLRFRRVWGAEAETTFPRFATLPLLKPGSSARSWVDQWLADNRRYPARPLLAFSPFANTPARCLPFTSICAVLSGLESDLDVEAILLGGADDATAGDAAIRESGAGVNACGAFSLEESAAFLQRCRLVVATDSGPMHLAGAVGVPSVATFSRVSLRVNRWFPITVGSTILFRDVDCVGCNAAICQVPGHPCLDGINANHIIAAAANRLRGSSAPPASIGGTSMFDWTTEVGSAVPVRM